MIAASVYMPENVILIDPVGKYIIYTERRLGDSIAGIHCTGAGGVGEEIVAAGIEPGIEGIAGRGLDQLGCDSGGGH